MNGQSILINSSNMNEYEELIKDSADAPDIEEAQEVLEEESNG